eukprot:scaffold1384_cov140-Skeletonema_menzelii.AAC.2
MQVKDDTLNEDGTYCTRSKSHDTISKFKYNLHLFERPIDLPFGLFQMTERGLLRVNLSIQLGSVQFNDQPSRLKCTPNQRQSCNNILTRIYLGSEEVPHPLNLFTCFRGTFKLRVPTSL